LLKALMAQDVWKRVVVGKPFSKVSTKKVPKFHGVSRMIFNMWTRTAEMRCEDTTILQVILRAVPMVGDHNSYSARERREVLRSIVDAMLRCLKGVQKVHKSDEMKSRVTYVINSQLLEHQSAHSMITESRSSSTETPSSSRKRKRGADIEESHRDHGVADASKYPMLAMFWQMIPVDADLEFIDLFRALMPGGALSCLLNKDEMCPALREKGDVQFLEDILWNYLAAKVRELTIAIYAPTFVTVKTEFAKMMSIKAKTSSDFDRKLVSRHAFLQQLPETFFEFMCLADIYKFQDGESISHLRVSELAKALLFPSQFVGGKTQANKEADAMEAQRVWNLRNNMRWDDKALLNRGDFDCQKFVPTCAKQGTRLTVRSVLATLARVADEIRLFAVPMTFGPKVLEEVAGTIKRFFWPTACTAWIEYHSFLPKDELDKLKSQGCWKEVEFSKFKKDLKKQVMEGLKEDFDALTDAQTAGESKQEEWWGTQGGPEQDIPPAENFTPLTLARYSPLLLRALHYEAKMLHETEDIVPKMFCHVTEVPHQGECAPAPVVPVKPSHESESGDDEWVGTYRSSSEEEDEE